MSAKKEVEIMLWLFVAASALCAVYALTKTSWIWMIISAALYYPFVWYLDKTPRFAGAAAIAVLHLASSAALYFNKKKLAWAVLLPTLAFTVWIAVLVLAEHR